MNSNVLADESLVEPLSGNAVLNGIPVEVEPVGDDPAQTSSANGGAYATSPRAAGS